MKEMFTYFSHDRHRQDSFLPSSLYPILMDSLMDQETRLVIIPQFLNILNRKKLRSFFFLEFKGLELALCLSRYGFYFKCVELCCMNMNTLRVYKYFNINV